MNRYWLGVEFCISDEVVRGGENLNYTEEVSTPRMVKFTYVIRDVVGCHFLLGRKMSEGTLISRPLNILNGETTVDVSTMALYA
ncbi:hypothetical protein TSMEX_011521 [Taenia solium]|eukprot:TsM_000908100 transcript=TsM_000908100 gene=TsM_000908100